jgi:hypothetical protein
MTILFLVVEVAGIRAKQRARIIRLCSQATGTDVNAS